MKGESKNIWDTPPTNSVTLIFLSFTFLIYKVKKIKLNAFFNSNVFLLWGMRGIHDMWCALPAKPEHKPECYPCRRAVVSVVFALCTTTAEQLARNGSNMLKNVSVFLFYCYQHNFNHLPLLIKITTSFENTPTNSIVKCLLEFCINLILNMH